MMKIFAPWTIFLVIISFSPAAAQDSKNRALAIHNHLSEPVYHLNWSNTAESDWGIDQLGSDVLLPGRARVVKVDDGSGACHFDFRVVTKSGRTYTKKDINVCAESAVEFGTEINHR